MFDLCLSLIFCDILPMSDALFVVYIIYIMFTMRYLPRCGSEGRIFRLFYGIRAAHHHPDDSIGAESASVVSRRYQQVVELDLHSSHEVRARRNV